MGGRNEAAHSGLSSCSSLTLWVEDCKALVTTMTVDAEGPYLGPSCSQCFMNNVGTSSIGKFGAVSRLSRLWYSQQSFDSSPIHC